MLFRLSIFFLSTLCYLSMIENQRRYSSRLSIPMFIGAPCTWTKFNLSKSRHTIKDHLIPKIRKKSWKWRKLRRVGQLGPSIWNLFKTLFCIRRQTLQIIHARQLYYTLNNSNLGNLTILFQLQGVLRNMTVGRRLEGRLWFFK